MQAAKEINEAAKELAEKSTKRNENVRQSTNYSLEKLGETKISIMAKNLKRFVDSYSQIKNFQLKDNSVGVEELKNFSPDSKEFLEMKDASFKASELATGVTGGLAAGTLTAAGAYGAVGALATASTGTAIAGLSGAAATNATLAWLGGGAISAGGGGIAAGTMVLGGLVAIPALVVTGWYLSSKAEKALNEANSNKDKARKYEQEVNNLCTAMNAIKERADQIKYLLNNLDQKFGSAVDDLETTLNNCGCDARYYDDDSVYRVIVARELAFTIKTVLDTSLLRENGSLNEDSCWKSLEVGRKALAKFN